MTVKLLFGVLMLALTGCNLIVAESQRSESLEASDRLAIGDHQLELEVYLWSAEPPGSGKMLNRRTIHAQAVVQETTGKQLPPELRLDHYQFILDEPTGVWNYRVERNGSVRHEGNRLVLTFDHLMKHTKRDVPVHVSVSLTDDKGTRYQMTSKALDIYGEPQRISE